MLKRKEVSIWIVKLVIIGMVLILFSAFLIAYGYGPGFTTSDRWQWNMSTVGVAHGVYNGAIAFSDVDNDGDLDLAMTGRYSINSFPTKIYINNGTSLEEKDQWQWNLTEVEYSSLAWGDVDNDGNLDLVVTGCTHEDASLDCDTYGAFIYINNGTSLEENITWQQNLTGVYESTVVWGDVDFDGDLDLGLIGCSSFAPSTCQSVESKIYINNGTTLEESEEWQSNLTNIYQGNIAFGDVDNDGDLDLALTGRDIGNTRYTDVYLNNGSSFVVDTTWSENLIKVKKSSLIWADYDNDGLLDLMVLGFTDSVNYYKNNGTTLIRNQTHVNDDGDVPKVFSPAFHGSISSGDYDNNGYLDLIITGREVVTDIYDNQEGVFEVDVVSRSGLRALEYSSLAFSDIDNDNDLDFILSGATSLGGAYTEIYISNQSETYANTPPTAPTLNFENYSTADGIFFGWGTGNDTETNHTGLYYNLRIGSTSGGNQIVTGVYGGGEDNGYFGNMMQRRNITLKPDRFSNFTNYYWSVQTIDTALNASNWSEEQMYTTGTDIIYPEITLDYPPNNFGQANNSVTFNYTIIEENMDTCELMGNWSNWHVNQSITNPVNDTTTNFTTIELNEGVYIWNVMCNDSVNNRKLASENYSLWIDLTDPDIELKSPGNDTTYTQGNVTFVYNVTDRDVNNCSLFINDALNSTDTSISTGENQSFTVDLYNDDYNWSINCTDRANNVNNSITNFVTVNCEESWTCTGWNACQGGTQTRTCVDANNCPAENNKPSESQACGTTNAGPGGGSTSRATASPTITTDKQNLMIEATQGEIAVETIKIRNDNAKNVNYEITTDLPAIIEPSTFTLEPGQKQTVKINLIATAEPGTYAGTIIIKTDNIQKTIITAMTIKRREALFDVKVEIPDKFKTIFIGESIIADITLLNIGKIGQVDVNINYAIKDSEGNTITHSKETIGVEVETSFTKTLTLPEGIIPGTYTYFVDVIYNDTSTTGETTFTIKKKIPFIPGFIQKRYFEILIWVIGTAVLLTAFFIAREKYFKKMIKDVKRKEKRLEKEQKKEKAILQKVLNQFKKKNVKKRKRRSRKKPKG